MLTERFLRTLVDHARFLLDGLRGREGNVELSDSLQSLAALLKELLDGLAIVGSDFLTRLARGLRGLSFLGRGLADGLRSPTLSGLAIRSGVGRDEVSGGLIAEFRVQSGQELVALGLDFGFEGEGRSLRLSEGVNLVGNEGGIHTSFVLSLFLSFTCLALTETDEIICSSIGQAIL